MRQLANRRFRNSKNEEADKWRPRSLRTFHRHLVSRALFRFHELKRQDKCYREFRIWGKSSDLVKNILDSILRQIQLTPVGCRKFQSRPDNTAVRVALWQAMHVQIDPPPVLEDDSHNFSNIDL